MYVEWITAELDGGLTQVERNERTHMVVWCGRGKKAKANNERQPNPPQKKRNEKRETGEPRSYASWLAARAADTCRRPWLFDLGNLSSTKEFHLNEIEQPNLSRSKRNVHFILFATLAAVLPSRMFARRAALFEFEGVRAKN